MSRRGDGATAPTTAGSSYYGRPVLKRPVWKSPDVPGYLFLGGLAGASSLMASFADATGRPRLARTGRLTAAAAAGSSVAALIHDLGRPERFLNMLRVAKPTSPLSTGSWILASFGTLAGAAAVSEVTGVLPVVGRAAGTGAAVLGPALATYTAVLLADTAVPAWHEAYRQLPFVFAGGALASAGAVGMLAVPQTEAGPARRMAVFGAVLEAAAATWMERRLGFVGEPYRTGRPGRLLRAARLLTAAGGVGAALARGRAAATLSGTALLAGAAGTRFGIFEAGFASAGDPKYTVVPQRARLRAAAAGEAASPLGVGGA